MKEADNLVDDYAAYLLLEAQSDVVALHQFRILHDPGSDAVHLFFEGEDDSLFYMPEARRRLNSRLAHVYDCGGKSNVIQVRESVKSDGYDLRNCLFFVDRDYDDFFSEQVDLDQNTYITDNYSIENDVCSQGSVEIILDEVIRLSRADPEFSRVVVAYQIAYSKFLLEIRPLIAWVLASRDSKLHLNLKNTTGLNKIMIVDQDGHPEITSMGFRNFRKKVSRDNSSPPFSLMLRWRRRLSLSTHKQWVRGKYDIWFFHVILAQILGNSSARRKAAGGRAHRIPSSVREGKFFEVVGGRVLPPKSLRDFLDAKLC